MFSKSADCFKDESYAVAAVVSDGESTCADEHDNVVDLTDQSEGERGDYEEFSNVMEIEFEEFQAQPQVPSGSYKNKMKAAKILMIFRSQG